MSTPSNTTYTTNFSFKKPGTSDVVNIDDLNGNMDMVDTALFVAPNQAISAPTSAAGDTTANWISKIANRLKAILGTTNFYDTVPTTLTAAANHIAAAAPHSGHETLAGSQAKVDAHAALKYGHGAVNGSTYIAITTRSDQAVSYNNLTDKPTTFAPSAHSHAIGDLPFKRGNSSFVGSGGEKTIAHGMGTTPIYVSVTPTANPGGDLGEVWVRKDATNIYVGNSGSFTGTFDWWASL